MDNRVNVPLDGCSLNIVNRCSSELRRIIRHKFQCEATFEGVDFQGESNTFKKKKAPDAPAKRLEVDLPSGDQVSVWKGDLTNFRVDAVVNAANSRLQHSGGLAAALSEAGGPLIAHESKDYIRKNGHLATGEAIICNAGDLPCKKLIHAVGPELTRRSQVNQARPFLEKTIRSILDIAVKHQLTTVAIPAISSGLFNYPLADCAETIVRTVKLFCLSPSNRTPLHIHLVNHDEPTVAQMERACREIIRPQSSMLSSQAVPSHAKGAANASPSTVQIGNVLVMLKKDKIEEQHTDVIVNTTAPNKDLSNGQISSALLNKSGPEMQKEIRQARKQGSLIVTNAYRLKCKEVFHTFCVEKTQWGGAKILYDSVYECLWMAVTRLHKSVAFPAIGTGALKFSGEEVASIMCKAVAEFAPNCQIGFEVHFVIFPSDYDTFEAFREQMKSLKSKGPTRSGPLALEYNVDPPSKKAETPHISLMGPSFELSQEARNWLTEILFMSNGHIDILNNFILHLSDQEYRQLARLTRDGVSVEEFFPKSHACMTVSSESPEDAAVVALKLEAMLLDVQEAFVREEATEIQLMTSSKVSFERKILDQRSQDFLKVAQPFSGLPLAPLKVEKVENAALKTLFDMKKRQLKCTSSRQMYQCISAQFCNMVSHIGFHAEIAPPEAPDFGEGIYFAATVTKALDLWRTHKEAYRYFVVAEVLEGSSTRGKPGLILPPEMGKDSQFFHSVHGGPEISVIFSGFQALPRYIITCAKLQIPEQTSVIRHK